ncbi:hypothetical protein T492DRAFT_1096099 [Pavlovales sp. CCMP2436]|nr:hypothetical protein T492DRAFT_1096099 [Pavlovales sp. CCMP2436]
MAPKMTEAKLLCARFDELRPKARELLLAAAEKDPNFYKEQTALDCFAVAILAVSFADDVPEKPGIVKRIKGDKVLPVKWRQWLLPEMERTHRKEVGVLDKKHDIAQLLEWVDKFKVCGEQEQGGKVVSQQYEFSEKGGLGWPTLFQGVRRQVKEEHAKTIIEILTDASPERKTPPSATSFASRMGGSKSEKEDKAFLNWLENRPDIRSQKNRGAAKAKERARSPDDDPTDHCKPAAIAQHSRPSTSQDRPGGRWRLSGVLPASGAGTGSGSASHKGVLFKSLESAEDAVAEARETGDFASDWALRRDVWLDAAREAITVKEGKALLCELVQRNPLVHSKISHALMWEGLPNPSSLEDIQNLAMWLRSELRGNWRPESPRDKEARKEWAVQVAPDVAADFRDLIAALVEQEEEEKRAREAEEEADLPGDEACAGGQLNGDDGDDDDGDGGGDNCGSSGGGGGGGRSGGSGSRGAGRDDAADTANDDEMCAEEAGVAYYALAADAPADAETTEALEEEGGASRLSPAPPGSPSSEEDLGMGGWPGGLPSAQDLPPHSPASRDSPSPSLPCAAPGILARPPPSLPLSPHGLLPQPGGPEAGASRKRPSAVSEAVTEEANGGKASKAPRVSPPAPSVSLRAAEPAHTQPPVDGSRDCLAGYSVLWRKPLRTGPSYSKGVLTLTREERLQMNLPHSTSGTLAVTLVDLREQSNEWSGVELSEAHNISQLHVPETVLMKLCACEVGEDESYSLGEFKLVLLKHDSAAELLRAQPAQASSGEGAGPEAPKFLVAVESIKRPC